VGAKLFFCLKVIKQTEVMNGVVISRFVALDINLLLKRLRWKVIVIAIRWLRFRPHTLNLMPILFAPDLVPPFNTNGPSNKFKT
jgi:hypothetical protein